MKRRDAAILLAAVFCFLGIALYWQSGWAETYVLAESIQITFRATG